MAEATGGVTEPCEWCLTFAGRTKKGRACCELRALAGMMKQQREDVYMRVWKDDGREAAEQLKASVNAEYRRKVAFDAAKREALVGAAKSALLRPRI